MASFIKGDQVICLVRDGKIIYADDSIYDYKYIVEIIALYDEGYIVYIPNNSPITDVIILDASYLLLFKLDSRFLGSAVYYITDFKIVGAHQKLDGMFCVRCGEFIAMAAPNQPDGGMKCWQCRTHRYR